MSLRWLSALISRSVESRRKTRCQRAPATRYMPCSSIQHITQRRNEKLSAAEDVFGGLRARPRGETEMGAEHDDHVHWCLDQPRAARPARVRWKSRDRI